VDERSAVPDRMLSSEADRSITFGSDSFRNDPLTGLNVGVSRGATSFHDGTSMPQARPGCLSETHTIYITYDAGDSAKYRVDHKTNTLKKIETTRVVKIELVSSSGDHWRCWRRPPGDGLPFDVDLYSGDFARRDDGTRARVEGVQRCA
jgi:hypothetical protein